MVESRSFCLVTCFDRNLISHDLGDGAALLLGLALLAVTSGDRFANLVAESGRFKLLDAVLGLVANFVILPGALAVSNLAIILDDHRFLELAVLTSLMLFNAFLPVDNLAFVQSLGLALVLDNGLAFLDVLIFDGDGGHGSAARFRYLMAFLNGDNSAALMLLVSVVEHSVAKLHFGAAAALPVDDGAPLRVLGGALLAGSRPFSRFLDGGALLFFDRFALLDLFRMADLFGHVEASSGRLLADSLGHGNFVIVASAARFLLADEHLGLLAALSNLFNVNWFIHDVADIRADRGLGIGANFLPWDFNAHLKLDGFLLINEFDGASGSFSGFISGRLGDAADVGASIEATEAVVGTIGVRFSR